MQLITTATCGRCGVYSTLHPHGHCIKPRPSYWNDRHSLKQHVLVWSWIHLLDDDMRWAYGNWAAAHGHDWCQIVTTVLDAGNPENLADYDDLCDFSLPSQVGPPRPGDCYCPPDWQRHFTFNARLELKALAQRELARHTRRLMSRRAAWRRRS